MAGGAEPGGGGTGAAMRHVLEQRQTMFWNGENSGGRRWGGVGGLCGGRGVGK